MEKSIFGLDITPRSYYRAEIASLQVQLKEAEKRLEESEKARLATSRYLRSFADTLENVVNMFGQRLADIEKTIESKIKIPKKCHTNLRRKKE